MQASMLNHYPRPWMTSPLAKFIVEEHIDECLPDTCPALRQAVWYQSQHGVAVPAKLLLLAGR